MKNVIFGLVLAALIGAAAYYVGIRNGKSEIRAEVVQNQSLVKQIAELSSLEVQGSQKVTLSNAAREEGLWNSFKNYLWENTLQVTVPFKAKYGVDMDGKECTIERNDSVVVVTLTACKLLSLELQLDKLETMNQKGLFASATIEDLKRAQKIMYQKANASLMNDTALIRQAKDRIETIMGTYYAPLGMKVKCVFKD
jgi:hypothetical protein